jgi:hypothetical protein
VYGLHRHPHAGERMVVVSSRDEFTRRKTEGAIPDHVPPRFNVQDIDPIDLADFLPGLTPTQADLVRDYAHIDGFYRKLLAETQFGAVDNRHWFRDFPGLFDLKAKGKKVVKEFEEQAKAAGREDLTEEELTQLHELSGGTKPEVLARVAQRVKRVCLNRFFGGSAKGPALLRTASCVRERSWGQEPLQRLDRLQGLPTPPPQLLQLPRGLVQHSPPLSGESSTDRYPRRDAGRTHAARQPLTSPAAAGPRSVGSSGSWTGRRSRSGRPGGSPVA